MTLAILVMVGTTIAAFLLYCIFMLVVFFLPMYIYDKITDFIYNYID